MIFQHMRDSLLMCIKRIKKALVNSIFLFTGSSSNTISQAMFLRAQNITPRHVTSLRCKEVRWVCPLPGGHKCYIDGAARGSPGDATCVRTFTSKDWFPMWLETVSQLLVTKVQKFSMDNQK